MSTTTRIAQPTLADRGIRRLRQLLASIQNFIQSFESAVRASRAHSELSRLTDGELIQLGLSREQITEHVYSERLTKTCQSDNASV